jgi:hypothetical protein
MFAKESGRNEHFFNRGSSIDASYQVSVHLVKWFQRTETLWEAPMEGSVLSFLKAE